MVDEEVLFYELIQIPEMVTEEKRKISSMTPYWVYCNGDTFLVKGWP